jgi:hypothetical protein
VASTSRGTGQVDEQHRAATPQLERRLDLRARDDRRAARGRADHEVGLGEVPAELGQAQGLGAERLGQRFGVRVGPVRDHEAPDAGVVEVAGGQLDRVAGARRAAP